MISVLIPVKNGGTDLVRCLEGIAAQQVAHDVEIVVVDSGSTDGSAEAARRAGARVHEISAEEFAHGRTRNLAARLSRGDVLVFTTQDAAAANERWLASLVSALSGESVGGAYGRQLPDDDATPPERFFLDFMYGPHGRIQRVGNEDELTFRQTLFSNVNSAIARDVWAQHPFHDDMTMSEDQEWSRRVLLAGLSIVYEPSAAVKHSHSYTLGGAFRRFYASGKSAEHAYVAGEASRAELRRAMAQYARDELTWLWESGQRNWIPYTVAYELAKVAGLQLGLRHRWIPEELRNRLDLP
jgi:rhamnosyltransferase